MGILDRLSRIASTAARSQLADAETASSIFAAPTLRHLDGLAAAEKDYVRAGDPDEIWRNTGIGFYQNGAPYRELSDHESAINLDALAVMNGRADDATGLPVGFTKLGAVLDHPRLYAADEFPELQSMTVGFRPGSGAEYLYDRSFGQHGQINVGLNEIADGIGGINADALRGALLHEVNHAVQRFTPGFPKGGSVGASKPVYGLTAQQLKLDADIVDARTALDRLEAVITRYEDALHEARSRGLSDSLPAMQKVLWQLENARLDKKQMAYSLDGLNIKRSNLARYTGYRTLAGEEASFATSARAHMDDERRRNFPPWFDMLVAPVQQTFKEQDLERYGLEALRPIIHTADDLRYAQMLGNVLRGGVGGGALALAYSAADHARRPRESSDVTI